MAYAVRIDEVSDDFATRAYAINMRSLSRRSTRAGDIERGEDAFGGAGKAVPEAVGVNVASDDFSGVVNSLYDGALIGGGACTGDVESCDQG